MRAVTKKACKQGLISIKYLVFLLFIANCLSRQCIFNLLAAALFMNLPCSICHAFTQEKLYFLFIVVYKLFTSPV